jgi:hypothetical protein
MDFRVSLNPVEGAIADEDVRFPAASGAAAPAAMIVASGRRKSSGATLARLHFKRPPRPLARFGGMVSNPLQRS